MPLPGRFTAQACHGCTLSRIRCNPLATWAADLKPEPLPSKEKAPLKEKVPMREKALPRQVKGKGKKQAITTVSGGAYCIAALLSRFDKLALLDVPDELSTIMDTFQVEVKNNISELQSKVERDILAFYAKVNHKMVEHHAKLRDHHTDLHNGFAQVSKILAKLQASSSTHQSLLLSLGQQSREITMPAAPTIGEHAISTPSASSVISITSSTSSIPHIGTLTLDSPTIHPIPGLPGVGLSGPAQDCSPSQCMSVYVFKFCRDYRVQVNISARSNTSHQFHSERHGFNTCFPSSIEISKCQRLLGRVPFTYLAYIDKQCHVPEYVYKSLLCVNVDRLLLFCLSERWICALIRIPTCLNKFILGKSLRIASTSY